MFCKREIFQNMHTVPFTYFVPSSLDDKLLGCKNRHCFYNRGSCVRWSCFAINVLIHNPSFLLVLQTWVSPGLLNDQSPILSYFHILHPLLYRHHFQVCYRIIHPSQKRSSFSSSALQPWVSLGLLNRPSPFLSFIFSNHCFIVITFRSATASSIHLKRGLHFLL